MKKKIIVAVALLAVLLVFAGCADTLGLLIKGKWVSATYDFGYLNFGDEGVLTGVSADNSCYINGTYEISGVTMRIKYRLTSKLNNIPVTQGADSNGEYSAEGTLDIDKNNTLQFNTQPHLLSIKYVQKSTN